MSLAQGWTERIRKSRRIIGWDFHFTVELQLQEFPLVTLLKLLLGRVTVLTVKVEAGQPGCAQYSGRVSTLGQHTGLTHISTASLNSVFANSELEKVEVEARGSNVAEHRLRYRPERCARHLSPPANP